MPHRTNRERLSPGPTPNVLPWHPLATRDLADWFGVSLQAIYVWQIRRTGPKRTMTRKGRAQYRLVDAQHWLDGDGSPTAEDRIRGYLAAHLRLATCATGLMQAEAGTGVRDALARLDALSGAELQSVCDALDKVRTPWPKPRAAKVIGTGEVAAHV